jgi:hypothetical protein
VIFCGNRSAFPLKRGIGEYIIYCELMSISRLIGDKKAGCEDIDGIPPLSKNLGVSCLSIMKNSISFEK